MKFTTNTTEEQDKLIALSGRAKEDVQALLDSKIEEIVNQGKEARKNKLAQTYDLAEPILKEQLDDIVDAVAAAQPDNTDTPE